jgi:hypothetical protein
MSSDVIQAKVDRDLAGLAYIFNSNGLVEHPYFVDWISEAINNQEAKDD